MSDNKKTMPPTPVAAAPAAAPPDPGLIMHARVEMPAFLEKLASAGIHPRNEGDLEVLWEMGCKLYDADQIERQKQASVAGPQGANPDLVASLDGLNQALSQHGLAQPQEFEAIKQASFELTQQDDVAHAALALATQR
jgi:hypothetical protein